LPRPIHFIIGGLALVTVGLIILVVATGGSGFIIIFPFVWGFNAGDVVLYTVGLAAGFLLLSWMILFVGKPRSSMHMQTDGTYVRVEKTCMECGRPIPERGIFCAYCGAPAASTEPDDYFE
jgi:hypothetical protein